MMIKLKNGITQLENEFSLHLSRQTSMRYRFEGLDLLDKDKLNEVLSVLGTSVGSSSPIIIASLFSKYYSKIVAAGALYGMSCLNESMNLSLNNTEFKTNDEWNPIILLKNKGTVPCPEYDREAWRENALRMIFAENLYPVFRQLTTLTRIDPSILWANASYSVHWFYDQWIEAAETDTDRKRVYTDFQFVTKEAKAELFGLQGINPLDLNYKVVEHPVDPTKTLRIRNKCCLRYGLPKGACCSTCPRLDEEARKEVILANQTKK
jgi:ferric iron reductase protein FhuF